MEEKSYNDPVEESFSTALRICTVIGLIIMIASGFLYFIGLNPYLDIDYAINNWQKPSHDFWNELENKNTDIFLWFLRSIFRTDSISMMGIVILTLSPLVALMTILKRVKKVYFIMVLLLIVELVFSIVKPLL